MLIALTSVKIANCSSLPKVAKNALSYALFHRRVLLCDNILLT